MIIKIVITNLIRLIISNLQKKNQDQNLHFIKSEVLNILNGTEMRFEDFEGAFFHHQFYRIIFGAVSADD